MTNNSGADSLMRQVRAVLLNKPIVDDMRTDDPELQELQEAMEYLSECLRETNHFLKSLCSGDLEVEAPGRHNFIAGNLKELHAILKHMTWQTTQVAGGDYSQKVNFLGEFSDAFNTMTQQLKEREISLSEKSASLSKTMTLLKSVLDGQRERVLVIDAKTKEVIYSNLAARRRFFDPDKKKAASKDCDDLLHRLQEEHDQEDEEFEYTCQESGDLFLVRNFPVDWEERQAWVHYITDITDDREEKAQLQTMAYTDELTGAYNRRYCLEKVENLMERGFLFSIVLIDMDGLKAVNDTLGHLQGDDYIITVSDTVLSTVRKDDRFCRIGGDEFVLILPDCSEGNADKKMKRICLRLSELQKPYPVAISYGIISPGENNDITSEELLSLADIKMYAMKQVHKQKKTRSNPIFSVPVEF